MTYVLTVINKAVIVFKMLVLKVLNLIIKSVVVILISLRMNMSVSKKGTFLILKIFKLLLMRNSIQSK